MRSRPRTKTGDYGRAMRLIMELADRANPFVESAEPWKLAKDPQRRDELQDVCTVALNLFRQLAVYLAPVLPRLADQTGELLGQPIQRWDESKTPLTGTPVAEFQHMLKRVEKEDVDKMIEESKQPTPDEPATESVAAVSQPLVDEPLAAECTIDDFAKVDLRVARVVAAEDVPGGQQAAEDHLESGWHRNADRFCGDQTGLRPEQTGGAAGGLGRESGTPQDEVRDQRRNDLGVRTGWQECLPAGRRLRR